MSKIILIQGAGFGKTHIGDLLEAQYIRSETPCKRYKIGGQGDPGPAELKKIDGFDGYVIVETSLATLKGVSPWQTITVAGGR